MIQDVVLARNAIEALRSGVPSRHAVAQLGTTQFDIKDRFESARDAVAAGLGTEPLVLAANFGAGKSHLLEYFQALAERANFVTAYLVISPEMLLGNPHVVLKAIAESARPPGRTGKALRELSSDVSTPSEGFAALRLWARDADIRDRFQALLHLYEEFRADEELRTQILDDIEGKPLSKGLIKKKLKELGQTAVYDLTGPRNPLLAHDRIRVLARFFRACGCNGLVILFDELERLARCTLKQRIAAYEEIGWWQAISQTPGSSILPIFAMTSGFVENTVVAGKHDETRFAAAAPALDESERNGQRGINLLKAPPLRLAAPTAEQEEEVRYRIKAIYEQAYGVSVPTLPAGRRDVRTSIRADIRRWITLWDLYRYDPAYAPDLQEDAVEFDAREVPDDLVLEAASEEFS
ncbi:MAG: DUF2791 family P-loop domain-containing protein [Deltaproteobacteria bacterium]|nr:DUF2791 family P-loop domain-containing protein [Deltaproteobacteria bacterium]